MNKNRAIPKGYMTVGELAKKMGTTVRTLQYYDNEGLLSPSSESEGGRRLYTDKDMVRLHQILSLKSLGFSLDDIKNRLVSLESPEAIADVLTEQAAAIRGKINSLKEALASVEALKEEVLQMQSVDFKKYADIIINLQMKNKFYWLIKHFDDKTLDHFRNHFDKDSGLAMLETFTRLNSQAVRFQKIGVLPESAEGQKLAESFWTMVMDFTGGDMSMLPQLMEIADIDGPDSEWKQNQAAANAFIEPALDIYFTNLGFNPFETVPQ